MIREYLHKNNRNRLLYQQADRQSDPPLRITIRRYANYIVNTGEIISTIDYKTGGRPTSIKYGFGP